MIFSATVAGFFVLTAVAHPEWRVQTEAFDRVPGSLVELLVNENALPTGGAYPPELAPAWSAEFQGGSFGGGQGHYYYDLHGKRNRQRSHFQNNIFGHRTQYTDALSTAADGEHSRNMTLGSGKDLVCKPLPGKFVDPFVWLKVAHKNGTKTIGGVTCTVFDLRVPFRGHTAAFTTCLNAEGAPLELIAMVSQQKVAIFGGNEYYMFSNPKVGPQDPSVFAVNEACATGYPTPLCKDDDEEVKVLDLYRVHGSAEPPTLANHDVGDAPGDMAFFCAFNAFESLNTSLVTHWQVKVNSSFTQYSYCLFRGGRDTCMGGVPGKTTVGRESALGSGKGKLQGQCSPNKDVGSWYSFPAEGQCAPGSPVGTDGCTWGEVRPIRTVTALCILRDRGLQKTCAKEFGHPPFRRSTAIFEKAFMSSDPAQGGCPDAPGSHELLWV